MKPEGLIMLLTFDKERKQKTIWMFFRDKNTWMADSSMKSFSLLSLLTMVDM